MSAPRTVESTGEPVADGFTVLVAVRNPDNVEQLVRTAADLARVEDGSVHVVSVVSKDYDSPFGIFDDETIRTEFAGERRAVLDAAVDAGEAHDVPVTGAVVVDRSITRGVVRAGESVGAEAVCIGWTGPAWRPRAILGTTVDALLERAPMDVYVERIGATADGVERVLVPIAGGPHGTLAAHAGGAIAVANDASVTLLSVDATSPDEDGTADLDHAHEALEAIGSVPVEARTVADPDVVGTIVDAADGHDVVVLGATRGGPLRARLVGSIPRAVTDRTDRTVLLARRWTGPSRLTRLLGRLRRR